MTACQDVACNVVSVLVGQLVCVVLHNDGHRLLVQPVRLGHHAFTKAVRDVIRAQQRGDDATQLNGDQSEGGDVPFLQQEPLELQVRTLATGQLASGVAGLADGRLNEGAEVSAAVQFVLDAQAAEDAEVAGPLSVDFAFQVEGDALVGEVSGHDEQAESDPAHDRVHGQEGAVVKQDAGPSE